MKNKGNIVHLVLLVAVTALITGVLVYRIVPNQQKPTNTLLQNEVISKPVKVSNGTAQGIDFATDLANDCADGTITLSNYPYIKFSDSLKQSFTINETQECSYTPSPYAEIADLRRNYINLAYNDMGRIYIFHSGSSFNGMTNNFKDYTALKKVEIGDMEYGAILIVPGPYGISTLGYGIALIDERRSDSNDITLRGVYHVSASNHEELINLVKKYGVKTNQELMASSPYLPEYVIKEGTSHEKLFIEALEVIARTKKIQESLADFSNNVGAVSLP